MAACGAARGGRARRAPDDPAPQHVPEAVSALPQEALLARRRLLRALLGDGREEGVELDPGHVARERQDQVHLQTPQPCLGP